MDPTFADMQVSRLKLQQKVVIMIQPSAYKMGVSMRLFKLQVLSLFKLPFSVWGDNWSLNDHLRANFGPK